MIESLTFVMLAAMMPTSINRSRPFENCPGQWEAILLSLTCYRYFIR